MCKLKFWLTTNRIKLRVFFFGRYLGSSRKVVKPRNDREEDHTQVWHRIYHVVGSFFLCACILWNVFSWQTNRSLKKSDVYSHMFFQLLELKQSQWRRQQQWHLTEGFTCTLVFIFLHIYSLLYGHKFGPIYERWFCFYGFS